MPRPRTELARRSAGALGLTALLLGGCAASLRTPPPVESIGVAPGSEKPEPAEDIAGMLERAAALFARRPDVTAVTQARELYLAAARADERRVEGLLGAVVAGAWLVEHSTDGARRTELATEGVQLAQWCQQRAPERIDCDYRLALALGQQARERPATAADALPRIVALLEKVIATAPALDDAGGHRVLALVLLRAPAWPLGPGDPEQGLTQALAAVAVAPAFPPNLLTLSEALLANSKPDEARHSAGQAKLRAEERLAGGDPDASAWVEQAARAAAAAR